MVNKTRFVAQLRGAIACALALSGTLIPREVLSQETPVAVEAPCAEPDAVRVRDARRLYLQARVAYKRGRPTEALAMFRASYALIPDPLLLYNVALIELEIGRYPEARQTATLASRLGDFEPGVHAKLAARVSALEARQRARRVIDALPTPPPPRAPDTPPPRAPTLSS